MQKQQLFIPGPIGNLEAVVQTIPAPISRVGIICHPNPLQGGTMQNKVVTTIAKAFNHMSMAAVRFNYRGVERSEGQYGGIEGEIADCMAIVDWAQQQWPQAKLWFAGFSFGAFIAASVASKVSAEQLITIAPAVDRMPYNTISSVNCPWLVIQGENDDVVIPESVYSWFAQLNANKTLIKLADTGHFFHGKLIELQHIIENLQTKY